MTKFQLVNSMLNGAWLHLTDCKNVVWFGVVTGIQREQGIDGVNRCWLVTIFTMGQSREVFVRTVD